jgi:N-acyl-D-amino-acid deacylase
VLDIGVFGDAEAKSIDADGRVVCPGFIDLHRHADLAVLSEGYGKIELSQGITTAVMGNCGKSAAPSPPGSAAGFSDFADYVDKIKAAKPRINTGLFAGLGTIRTAVKGYSGSPFTEAETAAARELLTQALDSGALGATTGLIYVPETYSTAEEVAKIASVMSGRGVLAIHMRWETERLTDGVAEALRIAKLAEVPLHISHFKAAGQKAWENNAMDRAIELIENERAGGMDVTVDFYPYDCGSAPLTQMIPPSLLEGDFIAQIRKLGTPDGITALRKLLREGEAGWDNLSEAIGWENIYVATANLQENKRFIGKSAAEAVSQFGYEDVAEFVGKLLASEDGNVININRSMRQEDMDKAALLPYSSVISDSIYKDLLHCHPRLYGSFPKFLREYVRERKLLSLERGCPQNDTSPRGKGCP